MYNYEFYSEKDYEPQPQLPVHLIKKANQDARQSFRLFESWQVLLNRLVLYLVFYETTEYWKR